MARILYLLSDLLWVLMCLVGYRRKVIDANLAASFPNKNGRWRRKVRLLFYQRLCDYGVETLRLLWISDKRMRRVMQFENVDVIDNLLKEGRSVTVYFSHCFNWEWAPSVTLWSSFANDPRVAFCHVYRPLKNKVADRFFLHLRSRFHSLSLPKRTTLRRLLELERRQKLQTVTGFMSDQRPSHGDTPYEIEFLNRPTLVITGTETLTRKLGHAAVYWDISRVCRGRYRIVTRLLEEHPDGLPEGELTRRYFKMLEETIMRDPACWLWSHKRWKRFNNAVKPADAPER